MSSLKQIQEITPKSKVPKENWNYKEDIRLMSENHFSPSVPKNWSMSLIVFFSGWRLGASSSPFFSRKMRTHWKEKNELKRKENERNSVWEEETQTQTCCLLFQRQSRNWRNTGSLCMQNDKKRGETASRRWWRWMIHIWISGLLEVWKLERNY